MKMIGGPSEGKDYQIGQHHSGVAISVAPGIKVYLPEKINWYIDRFDKWIGFVEGKQVDPPLFGAAIYKKRTKMIEGKSEDFLIYEETKWPDDSLESFLRENPQ